MISFCTTIKNRLYQFERTFFANADEIQKNPDLSWFIVDFGSTDGLVERMKEWLPRVSCRIVFGRDLTDKPWHCSYAKNVAHRVAVGKILVNLDCDNFIGKEILPAISDRFSNGCQIMHHYAPICGSYGRVVIDKRGILRPRWIR